MLLKNCENNPLLGYWPTIHHLISKIVLNFKLAVFAFLRSIICSTIIKRKCVERNSSLCRLGAEDNCENFLLSAVALGLPVCHTFCTLLKSTHATELTRPTVILSINWRIEQDNAQRDSLCGTSSHRQSDSYDSLDDLENSAEWKFEGYLYFTGCRWSAGETYEDALRAAVEEQYLLTVPVPVHHLKMFTIRRPNPIGNCRHCRFEAMYRQNQRADDSGENG